MLTVMRLNARWASGARFRREIPLQAESPLTRGLKALHDHLQGFCDIRDVDTVRYLAPFVAVVRSARASGPLTARRSRRCTSSCSTASSARDARARGRRPRRRRHRGLPSKRPTPNPDEVTLMKLLELSALSLRCDAGILLSDLRIWEMFQVGRRARPPPSPPLSLRAERLRAAGVLSSLVPRARVRAAALDGRQHARAHRAAPLLARARSAAARHAGSAGRAAGAAAPRARTTQSGETTSTAGVRAARPPARATPPPACRRPPSGARARLHPAAAAQRVSVLVNVMRFLARRAAHPRARCVLGAPPPARCVRLGGAPADPRVQAEPTTVLAPRSSTLHRGGRRCLARRRRSSTRCRASCASICCNNLRPTSRPSSRSRSVVFNPFSRSRTTQSPARSLPVGPPPNRRRRLRGQGRPVRARPGARPREARAKASRCSLPRCASSPRACSPRALMFRASPRFLAQ